MTKILAITALFSGMLMAVIGTGVYAQTMTPTPTATPLVDLDTNDDGDLDIGRDDDETPAGAPQTGFGTLTR